MYFTERESLKHSFNWPAQGLHWCDGMDLSRLYPSTLPKGACLSL